MGQRFVEVRIDSGRIGVVELGELSGVAKAGVEGNRIGNLVTELEVDDQGTVAMVWKPISKGATFQKRLIGLPDLVLKAVAPNTVIPPLLCPVVCLFNSDGPSFAKMPIYSELELSPLKKNCCFGWLPCPLFVMLVRTMVSCLPLLVAAI